MVVLLLDPEEATLSPTWAPAVLDDPEVATALRAVADGCNRMVVFLPAVRIRRLLAAARVLEDAVAVVEQVVSKDRGASGSSCSNMGGHLGFLGVPGDVVAGNGGAGVVTRVVIAAVPVCCCVAAAVLLFKSPSV